MERTGHRREGAGRTRADHIVVLTSTLQKLATKRVVASRSGPPIIENYPRDSPHFRFEEWPVASFDEMAAALTTLQARPFSLVVRDRILEGTDQRRGIGYERGDIGNDRFVAGLDLDSCVKDGIRTPLDGAAACASSITDERHRLAQPPDDP